MGSNKPLINLSEIRAPRSGQLSKNFVDKKSLEGTLSVKMANRRVANGLLAELDDSAGISKIIEPFA